MPLRDHFRVPLAERGSWDELHGGWPMMMVAALAGTRPPGYVAGPRVHLGAFEIDVATFDEGGTMAPGRRKGTGSGGVIATWAPPEPTLTVATRLPDQDEYEVLIHAAEPRRRLVAAVEVVSPSNKDRPEGRRLFVAKCAAPLREGVSVAVVDVVTTRRSNLFADLVEWAAAGLPAAAESPAIYAAAGRWRRAGEVARLETWAHPLAVGRTMPTLPLWLAEDLAVPLDLEASYEETCRLPRIP